MLALTAILLFPLLFLLGTGVTRILYGYKGEGDFFWEDRFLAGIIFLIGLAEGAHLGIMARGQSISVFKNYYLCGIIAASVGILMLLAIGSVLQRKNGMAARAKESMTLRLDWKQMAKIDKLLMAVILLLFLGQLFRILFFSAIYQEQDLTLETVMSFLQTGKPYEINPATGRFYELGMPSRLKILCLPTLYAAVCGFTKAGAETVVWHFIPAVTLVIGYFAYVSLGRALFPRFFRQRLLFLLLISILISVDDYAYGVGSFGLLHLGFQGTTIRSAILMPFLFSLCLRKKWKMAVCVAAAEACITWTFYGLGMSVLVIAAFASYYGFHRFMTGRKEGTK